VKTLKKIGKVAIPLVLITIFALSFGVALAQSNTWGPPSQPNGVPNNLNSALINITNWILGFVALIAVLIIIWGGVQYLTAAGNEDTVATAKKTITWGIMGLVICGLAYAIVYVVVQYWLG
jgi:hypothetical protein